MMRTAITLRKELLEKIDQAVTVTEVNRSLFIRVAVKRELARLGFLSDEEKKALGVKTENKTHAEGV